MNACPSAVTFNPLSPPTPTIIPHPQNQTERKGYNGSQNWDTSFLVQALAESGLVARFPESMAKAYRCVRCPALPCPALPCPALGWVLLLSLSLFAPTTQSLNRLTDSVSIHLPFSVFRPSFPPSYYRYFDRTQIKEDEEDREYWFRHISKGGWVDGWASQAVVQSLSAWRLCLLGLVCVLRARLDFLVVLFVYWVYGSIEKEGRRVSATARCALRD